MLAVRKLVDAVYPVLGIGAQSTSTEVNSSSFIDTWKSGDFIPRRVLVLCNAGTVGTSIAIDIEQSDSSDGSDPSDLVSAENITAAGLYMFDVALEKRYVSVEAIPSGTCVFSVTLIFYDARRRPSDMTELTTS